MSNYDYKSEILERLQQSLLLLPSSKPVTSPNELAVVRCCLCGDSMHVNSAHMYIGFKEINGKQILCYDCKLCGQSGALTPSLLHRININDIEVDEFLKSQRNSNYIKTFSQEDDLSGLNYKYPKPTKEDALKLEYLQKRTKIDFSNYDNILKYKIVINFSKFLHMNKINNPVVSKKLIPLLDEQAVGFMGDTKTVISFRNILNQDYGLERFNIVHLYQNIRKSFMYIPPCSVDILSPVPRIAVSESSFNIINVQNYFYDGSTDVILASASRKSMSRCIEKLIAKTGFTGQYLDVYVDNDKTFSVDYFEKILEPFMSTFRITLILNTRPGSKDFGDWSKEEGDDHFQYKMISI